MRAVEAMRPRAKTSPEIPILCRFWQEDDVWNGEAVDLPVAVFGQTFEEALSNMQDAIVSHLTTLVRMKRGSEVSQYLRHSARQHLQETIEETPPNAPLVKMLVALKNRRVVALR